MSSSRWTPFREGAVLGPVTILKVVVLTDTARDTRYRIKWNCCNGEAIKSHAVIRTYIANTRKVKQCRTCANMTSTDKRLAAVRVRNGFFKKKEQNNTGIAGIHDSKGYFWPSLTWFGER